jgi:hypothetical protein
VEILLTTLQSRAGTAAVGHFLEFVLGIPTQIGWMDMEATPGGDGTHRIEGNICLVYWSFIYMELTLQDERLLDRVNAMVNVDNTSRWYLWSRMFLHVSDIRVVLLLKGGNVPNDLLRYIVITRCNVRPSLRTGKLY